MPVYNVRMRTTRSYAPIIAALLLLLPVLYVGSYLALVEPVPVLFPYPDGSSEITVGTRYEWGGEWATSFYWPLRKIDGIVRQGVWHGETYRHEF